MRLENVPLECGHVVQLKRMYADVARRNGWLYCQFCECKRRVVIGGDDMYRPEVQRQLTEMEATRLRKQMVGTGQPAKDEAADQGQKWTTEELTRDFEVIGFAAPFVVVRRKSDGQKGTLEFTHHPRVYFSWAPDRG